MNMCTSVIATPAFNAGTLNCYTRKRRDHRQEEEEAGKAHNNTLIYEEQQHGGARCQPT